MKPLRRGRGGTHDRRWYIPTVAILVAFLVLSGCAAIEPRLERGRVVTDKALQGAERFMCRVAPVGPVMDRYFQTPEKYAAWRTICDKDPVADIVPQS